MLPPQTLTNIPAAGGMNGPLKREKQRVGGRVPGCGTSKIVICLMLGFMRLKSLPLLLILVWIIIIVELCQSARVALAYAVCTCFCSSDAPAYAKLWDEIVCLPGELQPQRLPCRASSQACPQAWPNMGPCWLWKRLPRGASSHVCPRARPNLAPCWLLKLRSVKLSHI